MNEYISREELRKHLKECYDNELFDADMRKVTFGIDVYVENMPTADVQPVNQWISTKDRLPDEDGWYLVYKHNRVRVAEWCKDCWYNESDLPIDDCAITHWQLLPEPPKEGEHND